MALSPFLSFIIGFIAAFLGSLPFGPINLSVVDTTIRQSLNAGLRFALAAAIIEIGQSFIAVHCSMFITQFIESSPWVSISIALIFIAIGTTFLFKKKVGKVKEEKTKKENSFIRGLLISAVNMQAIPFWIFILTYLETAQMIHLNTSQRLSYILLFLAGVAIGKFLALLFVRLIK